MGMLRRHGKLLLVLLLAATLLATWIAISMVRVSNGSDANMQYLIQTPAEHQVRGVLQPGESRYVWKFVGEGGLRVEARGANGLTCVKDIYTVPPLGGKCEVRLSSRSSNCTCRAGF